MVIRPEFIAMFLALNNIPAATAGFIANAIIGTASIEAGPAKPPFAIPYNNTAGIDTA